MNIIKRFFNSFTSKKVTVANAQQYLSEKSNIYKAAKTFDLSRPELTSTIFSCVQLIANNISKLKLNVYQKTDKGREVLKDHSWHKTLAFNPDLRLSTAKWINYTVTKLLLEGGVYYLRSDFDSNTLQTKKELKELGTVEAVAAYAGDIFYKFKGITNWIASRDIVFFYIFSRDGVTPISPISALKNELDIQSGAEETIKNYYQNGLFQVLYCEMDLENAGVADKNKAREYFEKLEQEVTGSKSAFAGGLLRVPPMYKLKSISLPDLKFLEQSKFTESRIASAFNIPAFMLNINEGAAAATKIEAQALSFLNNCLSNITNIILAELNDKLLLIDERLNGIEIDFDYESLFTLDLESKTIYLKNLSSTGAISPNDIRVKIGMNKIDNEYMNYHYIQSQNQAIEKYDVWSNNKITPNETKPAE
ncbi:MAG TPA: phage portal protein [Chryseosolibacter sp.]|nr:phage portal protein [Chryseosolibacter sp.]